MKDQFDDVQQFHDTAHLSVSTDASLLRCKLVEEESREFAAAAGYHAPQWVRVDSPVDMVELADAAADLAYVALGTLLHVYGEACARDIWDEVQRSNMAKFPNGVAMLSAAGKVIKPAEWTPPDILGVLLKHGIVPDTIL